MARARMAISASLAGGLATVSISAAVDPKSRMKSIGPAPCGRSEIPSSRSLMSSSSFAGSSTSSLSVTHTKATPSREVEVISFTVTFSAMVSSIRRATSSSTRTASTPGQRQMAMAIFTGMSGSLRCGMRRYPNTPQRMVATRVIHAMCRFSVKNRAVLWTCSIIHPSLLCAMGGAPFRE